MKKILCIDGGGVRGLIPALVLAEIEKRSGRPAAQSFDLIAGSSAGALLALGLGKSDGSGETHYSAMELADIFQDRSRDLFSCPLWRKISSISGLRSELYSHEIMEDFLKECFGEALFGEGLTKIMVTSYDLETHKPFFFKNWQEKFRSLRIRDIGRASSAAPRFYDPAMVDIYGETRHLIDGGVFVNSPAVSAYVEARKIFPEERDFFVLSLGAGLVTDPMPPTRIRDWGKTGWTILLLACINNGLSETADYQMNGLLGERHIRLQAELSMASAHMDDVSEKNLANLRAEAEKVIRLQSRELDEACRLAAR